MATKGKITYKLNVCPICQYVGKETICPACRLRGTGLVHMGLKK